MPVRVGQEVQEVLRRVVDAAIIESNNPPTYSEEARRRGLNGVIRSHLVLASDGTIKHILVINPLPYGLTERSISAARSIKFKVATEDGHPVSQLTMVVHSFSIY
jgi:hypothetical protein